MTMPSKTRAFSNFSRAIHTRARALRPDNDEQLNAITATSHPNGVLARGNGLSYSDCCVLNKGTLVDMSRMNHILSFNPETGIAVCQGSVTFADLFLIDADFIPPVMPGTMFATLAGGIANDVHGKNNHHAGSLGQHIVWLDLNLNGQVYRCSRNENHELFEATIAGIGLTGIITQLAIRLHKSSRFVSVHTEKFTCIKRLIACMQNDGIQHDYQVAWLDLLNAPRGLLSFADHSKTRLRQKNKHVLSVPNLPIRLIIPCLMKLFNRIHFRCTKTHGRTLPLWEYNNPLDRIKHWNRLYGRSGLLQFQAVFDTVNAVAILNKLRDCIQIHEATPTLTVLKFFTQPGIGLLSFTQPGFTLAIDFIHNKKAQRAIDAMNQVITESGGKIYLAKDLRLNQEQFNTMYLQQKQFKALLNKHHHPMSSDMSKRLGLSR